MVRQVRRRVVGIVQVNEDHHGKKLQRLEAASKQPYNKVTSETRVGRQNDGRRHRFVCSGALGRDVRSDKI